MKIFAYFMALYILVLSVVPCSDVHNNCNDKKATTELTQNHDHQQDQDDNCSPFCICNCCQTAMTLNFTNTTFKIKNLFVEIDVKIANRNFSFISNFYGNIWQPPKILTTC